MTNVEPILIYMHAWIVNILFIIVTVLSRYTDKLVHQQKNGWVYSISVSLDGYLCSIIL